MHPRTIIPKHKEINTRNAATLTGVTQDAHQSSEKEGGPSLVVFIMGKCCGERGIRSCSEELESPVGTDLPVINWSVPTWAQIQLVHTSSVYWYLLHDTFLFSEI
ncbi:unnamed protein product [Lepidochelys olivacea]